MPSGTLSFGLILFRLEGNRRAKNVSKWDENANGRLISMHLRRRTWREDPANRLLTELGMTWNFRRLAAPFGTISGGGAKKATGCTGAYDCEGKTCSSGGGLR